MDSHLKETCLSSKTVFHGKIVTVRTDTVQLPNGKEAYREVVDHCGGVTIAALTDDNHILMVRQYRYPHEEVLLELPAGKLEPQEDPLEGGKRELLEEVGAVGKGYRSLGVCYPSPGCYKEELHLYACRVAQLGEHHPDEDEFLDVVKLSLEEAVHLCLQNKIPDAKTQIAILKLAMLVERGEF